MTEFYYRYDSYPTTSDVSVFCSQYKVIGKTPKGVWLDVYGTKRFVLTNARKHYACPTKELAKESFLARKKRQLKILRAQLQNVERAIDVIQEESLENLYETFPLKSVDTSYRFV